jgi:Bax protein
MEKILVPIFLIAIVVATVAIQPETGITAEDLDMSNLNGVNDKKERFFDFMRPIINDENARILKLREQLLAAKKHNNNKVFVARVAKQYSVSWDHENKNWDKLLERVDTIALELSLAQSADETGWGQSRFAKQGNNFFGQWCYTKGCGIIPAKRNRGSTHEVAKFNSVNDSVRSYIKNINTGRVYALLRKVRRENRSAGKQPDAKAQAGGLIKYSQRGKKYVKEIRAIIRANKKLMLGK